jgi:hypothetical protein
MIKSTIYRKAIMIWRDTGSDRDLLVDFSKSSRSSSHNVYMPSLWRTDPILLFRDRTNPLDFLSDQQIIRNYRLDREGIYTLCDELQEDLEKSIKRFRSLLEHRTGKTYFSVHSCYVQVHYYSTYGILSCKKRNGHLADSMGIADYVHVASTGIIS